MSDKPYVDEKLCQALDHATGIGITYDQIAEEAGVSRASLFRWRTNPANWVRRDEVLRAIGRLSKAKLADVKRLGKL